jgi:hypothetical protein
VPVIQFAGICFFSVFSPPWGVPVIQFAGICFCHNVSSVTNMKEHIFIYAHVFHQKIGSWKYVKSDRHRDDLHVFKCGASALYHDISSWNVSSVTDMISMVSKKQRPLQPRNLDLGNVANVKVRWSNLYWSLEQRIKCDET